MKWRTKERLAGWTAPGGRPPTREAAHRAQASGPADLMLSDVTFASGPASPHHPPGAPRRSLAPPPPRAGAPPAPLPYLLSLAIRSQHVAAAAAAPPPPPSPLHDAQVQPSVSEQEMRGKFLRAHSSEEGGDKCGVQKNSGE